MLDVEIVSQKELCWRGDATQVIVPGQGGSLGIMTNHTPFLTLLEKGQVIVNDAQGVQRIFEIEGDAFASLSVNQIIIVADTVEYDSKA